MTSKLPFEKTPTMTVLDAIYRRRAIRSYKPEEVDRVMLRALLRAAVQAPTAMHAEPWRFAIVQDRLRLQRYSELAKAELATTIAFAHLRDPSFNVFYDASTLVVICGEGDSPYVVADCWLAAQNLMLAAFAYGLGTCCIGFALPVLRRPDIKAELDIPADTTPIAAIIVGYPAQEGTVGFRHPPVELCWK